MKYKIIKVTSLRIRLQERRTCMPRLRLRPKEASIPFTAKELRQAISSYVDDALVHVCCEKCNHDAKVVGVCQAQDEPDRIDLWTE